MPRSHVRQSVTVNRSALLALVVAVACLVADTAAGQPRQHALESVTGLRLHNVDASPATLHGRKGLRLTLAEEAARRLDGMPAEARAQVDLEQLAVIEGLTFSSGVIEAEIAGDLAPGAGEGARGFVGIAFRLQDDMKTYDAFYLRPTNGRAEDQERRNRSVQYISHPDWPWFRLRKETPAKYESYVDLVPGEWTKVKIDVRGARARLYVHDQPQPTLIVNDVKSGAEQSGAVALWLGPGTVAHFRNLTVAAGSRPSAVTGQAVADEFRQAPVMACAGYVGRSSRGWLAAMGSKATGMARTSYS